MMLPDLQNDSLKWMRSGDDVERRVVQTVHVGKKPLDPPAEVDAPVRALVSCET